MLIYQIIYLFSRLLPFISTVNINNTTTQRFTADLKCTDYSIESAELAYNAFLAIFTKLYNFYIPFVSKTVYTKLRGINLG